MYVSWLIVLSIIIENPLRLLDQRCTAVTEPVLIALKAADIGPATMEWLRLMNQPYETSEVIEPEVC